MSKVSSNTPIKEAAGSYLEYCEIQKNLSQNTIKMYDFYLNDLAAWAQETLGRDALVKDLETDLIKKYHLNLNRRISSKSNEEFKRSTQKTFLVAVRAFLKYLIVEEELEVMSPEQVVLGKSEDRVPKVLSADQLEKLFAVQDLNKKSGVRDRAILEVLFSTGLRVSELVNLDVGDIDLKSPEFTVIGKGRKARTVYLSDSALLWLKRYLATRNNPFKPLFLRYSGKQMEEGDYEGQSLRLTVRSVERLIKKYVQRAGIAVDATPHTLRHSFATDLLRQGADLRSVQELLGHSNVSTTQIYTHVTNFQLREIHQKFHKDVKPKNIEFDDIEAQDDSNISSIR
jgi:site-specific recombinase XerD